MYNPHLCPNLLPQTFAWGQRSSLRVITPPPPLIISSLQFTHRWTHKHALTIHAVMICWNLLLVCRLSVNNLLYR